MLQVILVCVGYLISETKTVNHDGQFPCMALKKYGFCVCPNPHVFSSLLEEWDGHSCGLEPSAFVHTCAAARTC